MTAHDTEFGELSPSDRTLLGPGPSDVDPRVLRAMSTPLLGHLDPEFLGIMNDTMNLLRYVFQTKNELTIPMSGTGSAGMETILCNLIEPGDKVIVCVAGLFGQRMADIVGRCGGELIEVKTAWGDIIDPEDVREALHKSGAKLVTIVHAETSTGILQPLEEISSIAKEYDALLAVDTVTSLGGAPVRIDELGVDAAYSGTQKCLSCPPGLAPVTLGERARAKLASRKFKVQSWYLDLTMIQNYWGKERFYHHTAPISMVYALRESLRIVKEEGLEARFERHSMLGKALQDSLEAMGLTLFAREGYRAPMLTSVVVPEGVADLNVRKRLLSEYGIEIGGGLGDIKGKVWRIGLMGHSCRKKNVSLVVNALAECLRKEGFKPDIEAGLAVLDGV